MEERLHAEQAELAATLADESRSNTRLEGARAEGAVKALQTDVALLHIAVEEVRKGLAAVDVGALRREADLAAVSSAQQVLEAEFGSLNSRLEALDSSRMPSILAKAVLERTKQSVSGADPGLELQDPERAIPSEFDKVDAASNTAIEAQPPKQVREVFCILSITLALSTECTVQSSNQMLDTISSSQMCSTVRCTKLMTIQTDAVRAIIAVSLLGGQMHAKLIAGSFKAGGGVAGVR